MFSRQNWIAVVHALSIASMPFSTVIGLVLFGMLTAPPSHQKPPETLPEMLSLAESKTRQGKFDEAVTLYDRVIAKSPESLILANAYWGRGATHLSRYTRLNMKVRSLKLKMKSGANFSDDYIATQQSARKLFDRGIADHLKAAEIADSSGLTACGQEIRAMLPQLRKGMIRYNNPYDLYLKRALPRC